MTYREKIKIENPCAISEITQGGVIGCPGTYFDNAPGLNNHSCDLNCKACWDREIPEPTSFQEDMMSVLGDMTKAQAKFAIEWLWNKYFKE